jgi:hypothetical protein
MSTTEAMLRVLEAANKALDSQALQGRCAGDCGSNPSAGCWAADLKRAIDAGKPGQIESRVACKECGVPGCGSKMFAFGLDAILVFGTRECRDRFDAASASGRDAK